MTFGGAGSGPAAMLVVDMQVGLLAGPPKYDLQGVIGRINHLTTMVRSQSGNVIWVQHCGRAGDDFEPNKPGWSFLPELEHSQSDIVVHKTLNDPFAGTDLQAVLERTGADRVLIVGWATDFCVDATVRSAVSNNHDVTVVSDGHTVSDRPHLDAPSVIRHHNWIWNNLIHPPRPQRSKYCGATRSPLNISASLRKGMNR